MISKVIHYCWFGGKPLSDEEKRCIASWEKYFPGYEIKEWNETNFDLECCDYVKEAYQQGKWAFVSDYARFKILYEYGGIYFDTDVEVIKSFEDILKYGGFMGCEEKSASLNGEKRYNVNAGLGLGIEPGNALYKEILEYYNEQHFVMTDGTINPTTVVIRITQLLKKYGFIGNGEIERIGDITIYPPDFFCPFNNDTGELVLTDNSHSIHYYSSSWYTDIKKKYQEFNRKYTRNKKTYTIKYLLIGLMYRIRFNIEELGIKGTLNKLFGKFRKN